MDFNDIAKAIEKEINDEVSGLTKDVATSYSHFSPVDTGLFASSWGVVSGGNSVGLPIDPDKWMSSGNTVSRQFAVDTSEKRINESIPDFDMRKNSILLIENNLDYAEDLALGTSNQAPAGWINTVIRNEIASRGK